MVSAECVYRCLQPGGDRGQALAGFGAGRGVTTSTALLNPLTELVTISQVSGRSAVIRSGSPRRLAADEDEFHVRICGVN